MLPSLCVLLPRRLLPHVLPLFACCLFLCVIVVTHCCLVLSVGGGAGRLRLLMVLGPCHHPWGVPLTISQHPCNVCGMGARLICYPVCTIVLGLQKSLVRWGVMTMGGRSPSPAPCHVHGMGAPPVRCPAPSSIALRGMPMRGVDSGQHHRQHCGTLAVVKSEWWWWWRKGNKWSRECDHPTNSRCGNIWTWWISHITSPHRLNKMLNPCLS